MVAALPVPSVGFWVLGLARSRDSGVFAVPTLKFRRTTPTTKKALLPPVGPAAAAPQPALEAEPVLPAYTVPAGGVPGFGVVGCSKAVRVETRTTRRTKQVRLNWSHVLYIRT